MGGEEEQGRGLRGHSETRGAGGDGGVVERGGEEFGRRE